LDRRTLLSVAFTFNIIDPTNKYASIKNDLQAQLNAAGAEWSTHLLGNTTLQYDVAFTDATPPPTNNLTVRMAVGAAKSAQVVRTDTFTNKTVYQVGTATKMISGVDPNGLTADGGITIYGQNIKKWYFDPHLNRRTDPIPVGMIDGYSVLLQEIAHSLGFNSARDSIGNLGASMYTYDQHVTGFGFLDFGLSSFEKFGGNASNVDNDDLAVAVYGTSVPLQPGDPNFLGDGRFVDTGVVNQVVTFATFNQLAETDLSSDLMGGAILPGDRKTISKLDLAILKDSETPVDFTVDPTPEGVYTVNGTGLSDNISVTLTNGTLLIRVNKSVTSFDPTTSLGITAIVVNGLNGNDIITLAGDAPACAVNGGAGNDTIYGGKKGDSIFGGGGDDLIFGNSGGDVIRGGDGKDIIYGQGGTDRLFGDAGNDYLNGGEQGDRINGGGNADTVVGGTGDDFLFGDNGNDLVSGAGGKDRMNGGAGADAFYGGQGNDAVDYSQAASAVVVTIDGSPDDGTSGEGDNIFDAENVIGSAFDDAIVGDEGPNSLIGGAGNDTLEGGGGNDTLEGDNGLDVLDGGGGVDSLLGGNGNDQLVGGASVDRLFGDDGDDTFFTRDTLFDTLDGGDGSDSVTGDTADIITTCESTDLTGPPLPLP
jgi:Ca2+-binding RTX toxin-like protein